jgi:NAD(P)-dependent dehydrogenase (short-subunit alcohol dehydrogenase family)
VGELVLITGTSSGIGLSIAIECAAAGHRVIATMRDLSRRETLQKAAAERALAIEVEQLDVTTGGVDDKVKELTLKYGPIYGLVNNAGIAVAGVFEEQSEADIREQFETNVFGLFAVTRAVLPSMRTAGRGRIVNISSVSGRVGFPALSMYAATKHALEGFSEALRWEVEPFGLDVCIVEPGTFKTPIFFGNQRRGANVAMDGPYGSLNEALQKMILEEAEKAPPPDAVGRAVARLMVGPSPPFRTVVGIDARTLVTLRRMMPDRLFASGVRRVLGLPRPR